MKYGTAQRRRFPRPVSLPWVTACALLVCSLLMAEQGGDLAKVVSELDGPDGIGNLQGKVEFRPDGPRGEKVLFADCSEGGFSGRFDLKSIGLEPRDYDLIKIEAKADGRARLNFSLENYPEPGDISHWYALDSAHDAFDWRTVWVNLRYPEEIKKAGDYKGIAVKDPAARGLLFSGGISERNRSIQGPDRRIWVRHLRFCKKAVDVSRDQAKAPYQWGAGKDLVFTYDLRVANCLDRPVTAVVKLLPWNAPHAKAVLSQEKVDLAPREVKTVQATISLPSAVAATKPPLYSERFEVRVSAQGIEDSETTLHWSSDPIEYLTVTVPIADEKINFPLMGSRKDLPAAITGFDPTDKKVAEVADAVNPATLEDAALPSETVVFALRNSAWLYDRTGDRKYLDKGTAILLRYAEVFPKLQKEWASKRVERISNGIIVGNTLGLGWLMVGMRSPWYFPARPVLDSFDLLAKDMSPEARQKIIEGFIVPAAIQMSNHYVGFSNMEDVIAYPVMYAGIVARNWPLVARAYSGPLGLLEQIKWAFDDDGLCGEGHYHTASLAPIFWSMELLYRLGIDHYDERFYKIVFSPAAEAMGFTWNKGPAAYLDFLKEQRFAGKPFLAKLPPPTDGLHLSSATRLRWKGTEVMMNWGASIFRGSHDYCSLSITSESSPQLRSIGGGSYNHSSFGQSIIIVDEELQKSVPAKVLSVDVEGPVQHVMATSDKHYPGAVITRTFALIADGVLVVDRVRNDKPRTVDWYLKGAGSTISVPTEDRRGSWTTKADNKTAGIVYGGGVSSHRYARTDESWQEGGGRMVMLGAPATEILTWNYGERGGSCDMMVRRRDVAATDFVAFFSGHVRSVERLPVRRANDGQADAIGVKVILNDGKTFRTIVNYEPEGVEVELDGLRTKDRFATDY